MSVNTLTESYENFPSCFTDLLVEVYELCKGDEAIQPTNGICFVILLFCTYEYILSYITCDVNNVKINVTICSIP